jgi:GTP-binding protein LepA
LKSVSRGYASFDCQLDDCLDGDLVLMDILVNREPVDGLAVSSSIVARQSAVAATGSAAISRRCDLRGSGRRQ